MFQYATGRYLSILKKVPLKLDISEYANDPNRSYKLANYKIIAEIASNIEINQIKNNVSNRIIEKLIDTKLFEKRNWYWRKTQFDEINSGIFDSNILNIQDNCYLRGYWQSEKYFFLAKEQIRNEFEYRGNIPERYIDLVQQIKNHKNSVSVHVRRGDYLDTSSIHTICSNEYYQKAIGYIDKHIEDAHYYYFSDDIEWVQRNMFVSSNSTLVESSGNDCFDLELIRYCTHHINANSSFSWWGGWLGEKTESIIIVPNVWFLNRPFPDDRIPVRWIKLG